MKKAFFILLSLSFYFPLSSQNNVFSKAGRSNSGNNSTQQSTSTYQSGHSYGVLPDKDGIHYKNNVGTVRLNWHKGLIGNTYQYFFNGTIGADQILMGWTDRLEEDNNYWYFIDNNVRNLKICVAKDWSHVKAGMENIHMTTYNQPISPNEYTSLHEREMQLKQK